jgi:hypothetical protein
MTGGPGAKDTARAQTDERATAPPLFDLGQEERRQLLTWVGEHLSEVRQTADGKRPVYWVLWTGLAVGLAAYTGGYLIKKSTTAELLGLVGDLLYTFGWALWTGVVVVVFLQIIPEIKRRQYRAALDAYEATLREQARDRSDDTSPDRQPTSDRPIAEERPDVTRPPRLSRPGARRSCRPGSAGYRG